MGEATDFVRSQGRQQEGVSIGRTRDGVLAAAAVGGLLAALLAARAE